MERMKSTADFREFCRTITGASGAGKPCLIICAGTGGQASGSNDLIRIIKRQIIERNLGDRLSLRITGCQGFCEMDPFIVVEPGHAVYPRLKMKHVPRIIDAVLKGHVVEELLYREPGTTRKCGCQEDIPFFRNKRESSSATTSRSIRSEFSTTSSRAVTRPCQRCSTARIPSGSSRRSRSRDCAAAAAPASPPA